MKWLAFFLLLIASPAIAHDEGQWDQTGEQAKITEWYRALMRPDAPNSSCCGEADAYWCDDIHVIKDPQDQNKTLTTCAITDDRPDEPRRRPHIDVGTVIIIPDEKLKWDRSNPTGHSIVFLAQGGYLSSIGGQRYVFCFVQGTGI